MHLNACFNDTLFLRRMVHALTVLGEKNVSSCFHFQYFSMVQHHSCARASSLCKYLFLIRVEIAREAIEFIVSRFFSLGC
jgi:hypothetical protein